MGHGLSSRVQTNVGVWMWKAGDKPWEEGENWEKYGDIDNCIIQEAFEQKQSVLELDEYYIDLRTNIQTNKIDRTKKRAIKRALLISAMKRSRTTKRYVLEKPDLTSESAALSWTSPWSRFLLAAGLFGAIADNQLVERVEMAAEGILEEGSKLGKQFESQWIAKELRNAKDKSMKHIGICCARIFTMDSFLHVLLNKVLRESEVQSAGIKCAHDFTTETGKIHGRTLGPFCSLLWLYLYETASHGISYVYISASLSQLSIQEYKNSAGKWMVWNDFKSATKKKDSIFLESGNTIFRIKVRPAGGHGVVDVSSISDYPIEEEVLLTAGIPFEIKAVHYMEATKKYIIDVEL